MTRRHRSRIRGSALVEFTLVGIPLIFVLISVFEAARGMWIYTTMSHALKAGVRAAIVRGTAYKYDCEKANGAGNAICQLTVQKVAQAINSAGAGLIPADVTFTTPPTGTFTNTLPACGGSNTLADCLGSATNLSLTPGTTFGINAQYRFTNAISLFWPGVGPGLQFGVFNLPASAQEVVQY